MGKQAGAIEAVNKIVDDLKDRSGGDGFWDSLDAEIQSEIKGEWADIIAKAYSQGTVAQVFETKSDTDIKKNPKTGRAEVWKGDKKIGEQG